MQIIRFDGQAAIVTGAGGGIGRAIALELARRGAQVLVNDYGGDTYGHAGPAQRAETVAQEICTAGGQAMANGLAVGTPESARAIIAAALISFGRIDILVNNAGITLPGPITDSPDADVDNHFRVNLLGPYALMRAVWPTMRAQGYGRILNTTSNAALGIGFNAPYATTKAGLIGLTLDAAQEGKHCGICVNGFMPVAGTRMIDQIPDAHFVNWMRSHFPPEKVAAAMVYFLSRNSTITGHIISTGGGRVARVVFAEGAGIVDKQITAETLQLRVDEALNINSAALLEFQADEMARYYRDFSTADDPAPRLGHEAVIGAAAKAQPSDH